MAAGGLFHIELLKLHMQPHTKTLSCARCRVEEVTFGLVPPRFQFCTAKYDPGTRVLALGMDMHYVSSGMQAVVGARNHSKTCLVIRDRALSLQTCWAWEGACSLTCGGPCTPSLPLHACVNLLTLTHAPLLRPSLTCMLSCTYHIYQRILLHRPLQLTLRVRQLGLLQPFSVRLEVTHLSLEGRLNLALQLTHEPPGIKCVSGGAGVYGRQPAWTSLLA